MPEVSGWMNTDATAFVACPKPTCLAPAGVRCRTPKGRETDEPHVERTSAFAAHPDFNRENYTLRPSVSFQDSFKNLRDRRKEQK